MRVNQLKIEVEIFISNTFACICNNQVLQFELKGLLPSPPKIKSNLKAVKSQKYFYIQL